jgi:hypothetical protein
VAPGLRIGRGLKLRASVNSTTLITATLTDNLSDTSAFSAGVTS